MTEPTMMMTMASFGLAMVAATLFALLKGWQGWLDLKRLELTGGQQQQAGREPRGAMADLIEMADLRERVRKLETIASCIDL
jgi:hypothetical protein